MNYMPEYKRLNIEPEKQLATKNELDVSLGSNSGVLLTEDKKPLSINGIIDNNDIIDLDKISFDSPEIDETDLSESNTDSLIPNINEYILMILGEIILIGSLKEVENKLQNIIYKEDPAFKDKSVDVENIIILKRIEFKVGVSINE
jgi:hypothetical protein